jgi:hypothetical protein
MRRRRERSCSGSDPRIEPVPRRTGGRPFEVRRPIVPRPTRSLAAGLASALVFVLAGQASASVTWGPAPGAASTKIGWTHTWNDGDPAIAAVAGVSTTYLHAIFDSDYNAAGKFACDGSGVHLSPYFLRSANGGGTWSKPKRVSTQAAHAERATLAASGRYVYVAYMTQAHYWACPGGSSFKVTQPRVTYVRVNTNNGAGTAWRSPVKLPGQRSTRSCPNSGTGLGCKARGDFLYIAAAGGYVYVATTNVSTGSIQLWVSADHGKTWAKKKVGATTRKDLNKAGSNGGFSGLPAVAATGSSVGVEWTATKHGEVDARISSDHGNSWATKKVLQAAPSAGTGMNSFGFAQAAGLGTRLAFTWTTNGGAFVNVYDTSGGWQPAEEFATFPDPGGVSGRNVGGEGAMVALGGNTTIGITMSECNAVSGHPVCDWAVEKDREALLYWQSNDDGVTWGVADSQVAIPGTAKTTYENNFGSLIFYPPTSPGSAATPYAYYGGHDGNYSSYNDYLRVGSGLPPVS